MKFCLLAGALALAFVPAAAAAQQSIPKIDAPSSIVPATGVAFTGADDKTKVASPDNPLPVTTKSADGADATLGSTTDAPYSGTGAATMQAVLKGIYSQSLGPLPAGTATIGNVGGVQIPGLLAIGGGFRVGGVDGAGLYQDLRVDANGLFAQGAAASGTAVKGNPLPTGFSDGTNAQRWKGNPSNGAGYVEEQARTAYFADTSTALAANAPYSTTVRDAGGTINGSPTRWNSYVCFVRSDQQVTVTIRASNDNASFFTAMNPVVVAANTSTFMTVPIIARYWRCDVVNGSTAQTSMNVNTRFGL